jgi:hypothetical protein
LAKILFTNSRTAPVGLIIEPWAQFETVSAGASVVFEFDDAPPPEVQFVVEASGDAFIYLNSENVRIRTAEKEQSFGSGTRAPSFPALR